MTATQPSRHKPQGYANGTKPKRIDTPAGTVTVQVAKNVAALANINLKIARLR